MPAIEVSPGITISYERTGSGPSMLLVHGITESHHSWDPLVPALAEHFDVAAHEPPRRGKPWVLDVSPRGS